MLQVTMCRAPVAGIVSTMLVSHVGTGRRNAAVRDLYADTVKTLRSPASMQMGSVTGLRSEHSP
jgi:hypothetical protein